MDSQSEGEVCNLFMPLTLALHQSLPLASSSNLIGQQLREKEMGREGESPCLLLNRLQWGSEKGKSAAAVLLTNSDQEWRENELNTEWKLNNADWDKSHRWTSTVKVMGMWNNSYNLLELGNRREAKTQCRMTLWKDGVFSPGLLATLINVHVPHLTIMLFSIL